ncbi:MAG: hypothetical protein V4813_15670 [Gemmatimonadota bacterium]
MSFRSNALLLPCAALLSLVACAKPDAGTVADSAAPAAAAAPSSVEPTIITVVARDYTYDAPDTITAGLVSLRLLNKGPEMHHIQLLRFKDGKTYADFAAGMKDMKPEAPMPPWVELVVGPNAPADTTNGQVVTQELVPGSYALLCVIPSPDGMPHFAKGMVQPLTVIPATGPAATVPAADIKVVMSDYAWDVQPVITAGKHTVRLENAAEQAHEMLIVKLAPGKTATDFVNWTMKMQGPPPAMPMGGSTAMGKGGVAYLPIDLAPGEYALICFIPDAKDGKPHVAHGMVKSFTVS